MSRYFNLFSIALVTICAGTGVASTQAALSPNEDTGKASSQVAFVYVASSPSQSTNEVDGFSVAENGALTPVPGSPFADSVGFLAARGRYVYGTNGIDINSYSVSSDGALAQAFSVNAQQLSGSSCGGPVSLFFDRKGLTLYDLDYLGGECANNAVQAYTLSDGALTYEEELSASPALESALAFTANNQYAYASSCYHVSPYFFGYTRDSIGNLSPLNIDPPLPTAPSGRVYCPGGSATGPGNHVVFPLFPLNMSTLQPAGAVQLSLYTADTSGNLTTNSTSTNMPKATGGVNTIQFSPSGKLIAVGGPGGLQLFHFNGASPITVFTGLIVKEPIDQVFWDKSNHLYAISTTAGKLYVFTVIPTSVKEAPGSPHAITNPLSVTAVSR